MLTNGDSGNIGANVDPLQTMMIHWSRPYNGVNGENNSIGVISNNVTIEWRCIFHISHVSLHIEINDAIGSGVIGAIGISVIDTIIIGVNGSLLPLAPFFAIDIVYCREFKISALDH